MEIKKGDVVGVTVTKEWADAVGPDESIHYFSTHDTPRSRLFLAKVLSITDPVGLWVEATDDFRVPEHSDGAATLFVPWAYIIAVRSGSVFKVDRRRPGFQS